MSLVTTGEPVLILRNTVVGKTGCGQSCGGGRWGKVAVGEEGGTRGRDGGGESSIQSMLRKEAFIFQYAVAIHGHRFKVW